jgi:hypothetical protein
VDGQLHLPEMAAIRRETSRIRGSPALCSRQDRKRESRWTRRTPLPCHPRAANACCTFGFERNPWDRVGHFMQGFVPAILARELLLRLTPLRRGGWLAYLVLAACLSFSAFFELIEWWAALAYGAEADAFLATQGDPWDTQWDMFLCLCGAIAALLLLRRLHDRQLGPGIVAAAGGATP